MPKKLVNPVLSVAKRNLVIKDLLFININVFQKYYNYEFMISSAEPTAGITLGYFKSEV